MPIARSATITGRLVVETLERYDIDGLELDFMREPYLFSAGKEAEGAPILTAWIREIRKLVAAAAAKRGHPIRLGVRVPSQPETAFGMGLDAITWAKAGLIDLLVVTPRWATLEYDMPLQQWRQLLGGSKVTLAGGSGDHLPPGRRVAHRRHARTGHGGRSLGPLRRGRRRLPFQLFPGFDLAAARLSRNPQNHGLLGLLGRRGREAVAITFRDVTAPGEDYRPLVPATGREIVLTMKLGPLPNARRRCQLLVGLASSSAAPAASVNGKRCEVCNDTVKDGLRLVSFSVPLTALAGIEVHQIKLSSKDRSVLTIQQMEMSLRE